MVNKNSTNDQITLNEKELMPSFGYEVIKDILLPDILGKDSAQILYWAGKQLARKFPLAGTEDVASFFQNAGWGNLHIVKQTRDTYEIELTGYVIARRLSMYPDCHFQLEAGFLAEQLTLQKNMISEAVEEKKKRAGKVILIVKCDAKDHIE
ncbi:DUF2507 domain-containing protein [Peribacillus saganii]|uniref:DUF2507 domain-containing protein n=1 Tax=Peribacillus saganii TaxID=2303992 RepID=A0A372LR38_9BACI|nr:YslB family protein [Peribacillus saganii]RFU70693.1 DUF2507 domain-containing protein [Peribacillus saganii]